MVVKDLRDKDGRQIDRANVPKDTYSFIYDGQAKNNYFVRKVIEK